MPQEIDAAERERRRELALRLHNEVVVDPVTGAERRKFGGAQPGSGRPRRQRASTLVAEGAREHASKIKQALLDGVDAVNPPHVRVQAAKTWLDIEAKEEALVLDEQRALDGLQRDQLVMQLAEKLQVLADRGLLPAGALPAIEGRVVDVDVSGP